MTGDDEWALVAEQLLAAPAPMDARALTRALGWPHAATVRALAAQEAAGRVTAATAGAGVRRYRLDEGQRQAAQAAVAWYRRYHGAAGLLADHDGPVDVVQLKFQHRNQRSTLVQGDMAFAYPAEFGPGVGLLVQQRHGWISFVTARPAQPGKEKLKGHRVSKMLRHVWDHWHLAPLLPPEEEFPNVHIDPGFGPPPAALGLRIMQCSVCGHSEWAANEAHVAALAAAHPAAHTAEHRALLGAGVQHWRLVEPTMADLEHLSGPVTYPSTESYAGNT